LMGHRVHQNVGPPLCRFVPRSSCFGRLRPDRWVLPSNPELWKTPRQSWNLFWIRLPYPATYRARHMRSRMTYKIILIVLFHHASGAQPLCLLGCSHRGAIKQAVVLTQPTSSHTISHYSSVSFPTTEKREKNIETDLERQEVTVELTGICPSSLFHLVVESS
jgi:hypothetical protein